MTKENNRGKRILKISCSGCVVAVLLIGVLLGVLVALLRPWVVPPDGPPEMSEHHPFRSAKAQQRYLDRYDARGELWPQPSESRMVDTSFGQTFVRIDGPDNAAPIVLLPGANATSLLWAPNVPGLSEGYRTYAVDNIYDFGRSVYRCHIRTPEDFVQWLDQLFDALDLDDDVNLVGLSYGGWIASQYGIEHPDRLNSLVLVAPAATVLDFNPKFLMRGALCLIPHRYFVKDLMYWVLEDAVRDPVMRRQVDELAEDNFLAMRCFKPKPMVSPTILSDDQLRSLEVPVLFLVGENERIYSGSAAAAVDRLRDVAPQIKSVVIPNAGHDLTLVQAELVNDTILESIDRARE